MDPLGEIARITTDNGQLCFSTRSEFRVLGRCGGSNGQWQPERDPNIPLQVIFTDCRVGPM